MELTITLEENNEQAKALVKYLKNLSFVKIIKKQKLKKDIEMIGNSVSIKEARALTNKHIDSLPWKN
jgi:hypothetical protein